MLGIHSDYLSRLNRRSASGSSSSSAGIEVHYRYNPDVESLKAMVPVGIPLLHDPVNVHGTGRGEKELGSINNFYVTPKWSARRLAARANCSWQTSHTSS